MMPLRNPSHQAAIELGHEDTGFAVALKQERRDLLQELGELSLIKPNHRTLGTVSRIDVIRQRLVRIEELLDK